MFNGAINYNSDIFTNTGLVTNMNNMFNSASNFNQMGVSNWIVTNVEGTNVATTVDGMQGMFQSAVRFNQDITNWTPSKCSDFSNMFNGNMFSAAQGSLNIMTSMFEGAVSFTGKNIINLDTSNVANMASMFKGATVFNTPIPTSTSNTNLWKVEAVTTVASMFENAPTFN